jgi:hypothetical protein
VKFRRALRRLPQINVVEDSGLITGVFSMDAQLENRKKELFRTGLAVFILLALLTGGEFFIGSVAASWWAPLIGIALIKATLIIRDYMHIHRLFELEEVQE